MSRLAELIHEFCPDGVEYKTLGEIATDIYRGAGITREQITEIGIPCVRYGEIYTTYGVWFEKCVSHTNEADIASKKYFEHGDILFAITGESVEDIAKSCAYMGNEKCLAGGDIVVLKHNENPKYLAYVLSTTEAQIQKSKGKVKSKVVHSSVPAIQAIRIPVPYLPVQNEIVRILDNFTELTAELKTELTARKKQYEYYRDQFLIFGDDVEWKTLGEVCVPTKNIKWEETDSDYQYIDLTSVSRDTHVIVGSTTINKEKAPSRAQKLVEKDDVIFATTRPTLRRFALIDGEFSGQVCSTGFCVLRVNAKKALPKWVYYQISQTTYYDYMESVQKGAAYPAVSDAEVKRYKIPLPSPSEQERIVAILDKFDALINSITEGLPREIGLRQKQYKYYRDKLLTFKEKKA
ncbi:restriction endonuclease subunit S [Cloacibacillus porcorum]